ncbi:MAG: TatD family hydrolase [Gammaproteobacteria bacterium]|jgi:TatD DNase family protein
MHRLIDICFNFTHSSYRQDEIRTLQRAVLSGVTRMLVTGSDLEDSEFAVELAERYPENLYATVGVHPHLARTWDAHTTSRLRELAAHPKVRAIGEAGLDFNRNYSAPEQQQRAFETQLELACELGLPLFMHERDAHQTFIETIRRYRSDFSQGVVHCFTGTEAELEAYLDLDLHIGITGWICDERRGHHLKEFLHKVPPDRLMIETDAPYLLPRDLDPKPSTRRNEPMYLPHILKTVAAAIGRPEAEVAAATRATSEAFYGLESEE